MQSYQRFASSMGTRACSPGASGLIAIPNFSVQGFTNSCSRTIPTLLLQRLDGNPPGPVQFLFENTGFTFYGKGFEMLQVLHFCPSSISNTFATLLALFNTTQGEKEGLHEFRSHFEGNLAALSQSSVAIPPIPQVMFFLQALHSCYHDLLTQFVSKQKDFASATINTVLADARFMDKFVVVGGTKKTSTPGTPYCSPLAASVVTNKDGKEY
jgi:hypothetical protein